MNFSSRFALRMSDVPSDVPLMMRLHQHYFSANPTFVLTISLYQWLFGTIYFLVPLVVAGHRHQDVAYPAMRPSRLTRIIPYLA